MLLFHRVLISSFFHHAATLCLQILPLAILFSVVAPFKRKTSTAIVSKRFVPPLNSILRLAIILSGNGIGITRIHHQTGPPPIVIALVAAKLENGCRGFTHVMRLRRENGFDCQRQSVFHAARARERVLSGQVKPIFG